MEDSEIRSLAAFAAYFFSRWTRSFSFSVQLTFDKSFDPTFPFARDSRG